VTTSLLDRLTAGDREVLGRILGGSAGWEDFEKEVTGHPWRLMDLLADPALLDAVLDPRLGPGSAVSPTLLFAVFVCHAAAELRSAGHVAEWAGPHARVPVFDVGEVQEFLEAPGRVLFLVELLTSFAGTAPGRGIDDLVTLAEMSDDSPGWYRRLADLVLFLAGVFPDRTLLRPYSPAEAEKLGRSAGMTAGEILATLADAPGGTISAVEALGCRWYAKAAADQDSPAVVADLAARFRPARRILTYVSDRHLYRRAA